MPTIYIIFGINIIMNQIAKEHGKPHIHAIYGEQAAVFLIEDGSLIEGKMEPKQTKVVQKFITTYREELLQMWNTKTIKKIDK